MINSKTTFMGYRRENGRVGVRNHVLILPVDVRILGVEYQQKEFTGGKECRERGIELVFNRRDHSFSSSSLRRRVVTAETEKMLREPTNQG